MSSMSLRLPESLHRQATLLAEETGVSVEQLVTTALAEKVAALAAECVLGDRAQRGSRRKFEQALDKVRDVEPLSGDELPADASPSEDA